MTYTSDRRGRDWVRLGNGTRLMFDVPEGMELCHGCEGQGCTRCQSSGITPIPAREPCTCAVRHQLREIPGADIDALAPPCTHHPEPAAVDPVIADDVAQRLTFAGAEYDAHLLAKARELASLTTTEEMITWIRANHGSTIINENDPAGIRAYILGVTKATLAELVRWVERIPEANRG